MEINKSTILLWLSKKKLNLIDGMLLKKILMKVPNNDFTLTKLFLDNYYGVESLPFEFYEMFTKSIHSNKSNELINVLLNKKIYDLICFLKNDKVIINDIEDIISPKDYFELPSKKIMMIEELLRKIDLQNNQIKLKELVANKPNWLLKKENLNTDEEIRKLAIKMYISIGIDNSIDILNGKYGLVDYEIIHYLFNNLDIKDTNEENVIIFNDFLFGNKKSPNNNMKLMLNGDFLELFTNFDYFYNNINYFIEKLGKKLNQSKVKTLLKERYISPKIENPDLTGDILQDMISSYHHKYGIEESENEIINKNLTAYGKLKSKTKSSIIKTDIPRINDFTFELLPLNDVRNLVMGYRAGNCFRINGDAFILFNIFLTNPHMRILSISTDENKDFGMVLLMRNGNVLIAQGIELSKRTPNNIDKEKLYNSVRMAVKTIMDKTNNENDEIVATIIGLSNDNTTPYNHNILPFIINPVLESNFQYYNGIENYQGLLDLKSGKTIKDIKLFIPDKLYSDFNDKIYKRDESTCFNSMTYQQIEKILISLRYDKFKTTSEEELLDYYSQIINRQEKYTICTINWYITVYDDGFLDTYINTNNPEIVEEYNRELNKVKDKKKVLIKKM